MSAQTVPLLDLKAQFVPLRGDVLEISARRRNAERYEGLFEKAGLGGTVMLPARSSDSTHIYNQFVIRVPERDRLRAHLQSNGIGTAISFSRERNEWTC